MDTRRAIVELFDLWNYSKSKMGLLSKECCSSWGCPATCQRSWARRLGRLPSRRFHSGNPWLSPVLNSCAILLENGTLNQAACSLCEHTTHGVHVVQEKRAEETLRHPLYKGLENKGPAENRQSKLRRNTGRWCVTETNPREFPKTPSQMQQN